MKKLHPANRSVEIIKSTPATQPPDPDALVEEQDTCLLLGTAPVIHAPIETYRRLVSEMQDQKPLAPGEVLVRDRIPLQFIAIVYDIGQKPVCREEWITLALKTILELCVKHRIESLAMPPLGCAHGRIEVGAFMKILESALSGHQTNFPETIWILMPTPPARRQ